MKNHEKLTEADLLPHDEAEDLAYSHISLKDVGHTAIQTEQEIELEATPSVSETQLEEVSDYKDVPKALRCGLDVSTTEAAVYLGITRQELIKLYLDTDKIPNTRTRSGAPRRINFGDLEDFKNNKR